MLIPVFFPPPKLCKVKKSVGKREDKIFGQDIEEVLQKHRALQNAAAFSHSPGFRASANSPLTAAVNLVVNSQLSFPVKSFWFSRGSGGSSCICGCSGKSRGSSSCRRGSGSCRRGSSSCRRGSSPDSCAGSRSCGSCRGSHSRRSGSCTQSRSCRASSRRPHTGSGSRKSSWCDGGRQV